MASDSNGKEHYRRKMENRDRRTKETGKLKKSGPDCRPYQVTTLKVIKPVSDLFRKEVDYRTYRLTKHSTWYNDDVTEKLQCMAKKTAV